MNLRKHNIQKESNITRPNNIIWKTKNAEEIDLYDMSIMHIINCILLIKKNLYKHKYIKNIYTLEQLQWEYALIQTFKDELDWRKINEF